MIITLWTGLKLLRATRIPIVFDNLEDKPSRIIDKHVVFHLLRHPEAFSPSFEGLVYPPGFPACFIALSRGQFEQVSSEVPKSAFHDNSKDRRSTHYS